MTRKPSAALRSRVQAARAGLIQALIDADKPMVCFASKDGTVDEDVTMKEFWEGHRYCIAGGDAKLQIEKLADEYRVADDQGKLSEIDAACERIYTILQDHLQLALPALKANLETDSSG